MSIRSAPLTSFIDAAEAAFRNSAPCAESDRLIRRVFGRLQTAGARSDIPAQRQLACRHLDAACAAASGVSTLSALVENFKAMEPSITWRLGVDRTGTGSPDLADGHANGMVVGPGGFEDRSDVWLGATVLAPHIRYPDHNHPPEEVYLVASHGEFMHGDSGWFSPPIGSSFYNTPGITHAMRANDRPLFAFWILLPEQA